ncbi:MAG: 1-acyl-sn-glycerol-3-phosphate acyltransferase [Candidatus Aminicenantes bacterium]|nr:1-acyl-sn-glycerol-3-phosphate acyltransferase [Candidatus Aminicenantes bacterium]
MRTILLGVVYVILIFVLLLVLLIFWPFGQREPLLRLGRWAMSLAPGVLGIKINVSGRDRIDGKTPYIFMSNHLSFLDGPLLFLLIPQSVRVILKKEVFRIPVVGQGMRFVGFVPVDRKRARGGKKSIDQAACLMRERGYSYLIFPEGTRTRDGRIQAFKRGGFFLALESGAAIAPITIRGTYELMPRGTMFVRRGKIDVLFHPPVPAEGYDQNTMQTLVDKVRETIVSGLPA